MVLYDFYYLIVVNERCAHSFVYRAFTTRKQKSYALSNHEVMPNSDVELFMCLESDVDDLIVLKLICIRFGT